MCWPTAQAKSKLQLFQISGVQTAVPSILAESQTALKLSFNRPDQDLARPCVTDVSRLVIFFLSRAADSAASIADGVGFIQEGALGKIFESQRMQ